MARFIAIKTTVTTPKLAYRFVDELFRFYGLLMDIVSDHDPEITSDFWTQVFKKLQTTLSMSSTNHPQYDGQTERVNHAIRSFGNTFDMPTSYQYQGKCDVKTHT